MRSSWAVVCLLCCLTACSSPAPAPAPGPARVPVTVLEQKLASIAQVEMTFDASALPPWQREVLRELVAAVDLVDRAFWEQSHPPAWDLLASLSGSERDADAMAAALLRFHAGPFDRLQGLEPFLGDRPRPPGGGLYPPYLTRTELESILEQSPSESEAILDPYSVVRRRGDGLAAVPYHEAYSAWTGPAARRLRNAAAACAGRLLADHLVSRAIALETGDWTDPGTGDRSAHELAVILGPYDRGEDRLLGRKASLVAMIGVPDPKETGRLEPFLGARQSLADHLPHTRDAEVTGSASVVVATEVRRGGRPAHGTQPVAWTVSGDGSFHTVLWRNRIDARRDEVLAPLAERVLDTDQATLVTPGGYFTLVLMRELAHTLSQGPVALRPAPGDTIEEARAAAVGLHSLEWFLRRGVLPASMAREHHATHLVDLLATIRTGSDSPRGLASLVALNWHREHGGILYDPDSRRWSVVAGRMLDSSTALASELLAIEGSGDRDRAIALLSEYGNAGPEIRATVARASDLPLEVAVEHVVRWE